MENGNTAPKSGSGQALASLILGIISLVLAVAWFIAPVLGLLAIIFGALTIKRHKGKALTGIITGSLGIVFSIGFILLFVLGIPALQKTQRDNNRKTDVARISAEVMNYQNDHMGEMPDVAEIESSWSVVLAVEDFGSPTTETAIYRQGENCDGDVSERNHSVTILLENGDTYCLGS